MQIYDCEIGVVKCFAVYFQKSLVYCPLEFLKNESFSFSLTLEETKVHLIRTPEKSLLLFRIKIKNKSTKKPPVGTGGY